MDAFNNVTYEDFKKAAGEFFVQLKTLKKQVLCHSEQKSWGSDYSAWMQKQEDDQIEVECESCGQKQLMPINQVLTRCENCGDWFG